LNSVEDALGALCIARWRSLYWARNEGAIRIFLVKFLEQRKIVRS
jgi:hypothetical protein